MVNKTGLVVNLLLIGLLMLVATRVWPQEQVGSPDGVLQQIQARKQQIAHEHARAAKLLETLEKLEALEREHAELSRREQVRAAELKKDKAEK